MKFEPAQRRLQDLVQDFNDGAILLPQFQRDYIWKPTKIRNLLDSLLRGFPIGGFYLWKPSGRSIDAKQKALGPIKFASEAQSYLIDGQQRLTSLEAAFGLYSGEDKGGQELVCYLDLASVDIERARDTRLFVSYGGNQAVKRRVDDGDSTLIPVSRFFSGRDPDLRDETKQQLESMRWARDRIDKALRRVDNAFDMLSQIVPCTIISDVSDQEAVEIFSRLNKGGSPLSQGDVKAAELARGPAVEVLKRMRVFVTEERPKRLGFGFSFAFRALVLFHQGSAGFKSLKPDWVNTVGAYDRPLAESWKVAERALGHALEFVDRLGWSQRALLPSAIAVIILAAALDSDDSEVRAEDEQLYRRWLCLTALRGVFQSSVETTINRFFRAIRDGKAGAASALVRALKSDGAKIDPDELNRHAQPWGPPTQVMHAWFVSQRAKDWMNGRSIEELARDGAATQPGGDLTVHHLFPRKYLTRFREHADDANRGANYALLSRPTNSGFKDKPPDEVLSTLTPEERKRAATQFFDNAAGDRLRGDQYDEFCEWRSQKIARGMNEWLGLERVP